MGINIVDVFFDVVKQSITNNDGDYQLPKHAAYFDSMRMEGFSKWFKANWNIEIENIHFIVIWSRLAFE